MIYYKYPGLFSPHSEANKALVRVYLFSELNAWWDVRNSSYIIYGPNNVHTMPIFSTIELSYPLLQGEDL
jgi:hypothetical protein